MPPAKVIDRLRRLLRAPLLVVSEAAGIALAALISTAVPQAPSLTERTRFAAESPVLERAAAALGLHHVFSSPWFLALVLLAAASLLVVLMDQVKTLLREWRSTPAAGSFGAAPFRAEFMRPARGGAPSERIERTGRLGLAGSAVFHLGLLALIGAGVARLLVGADAAVELFEGETLATDPAAFQAQWPGLAAEPVASPAPVTILQIAPRRYPSRRLARLAARVRVGDGERALDLPVEVNAPLDLGGTRLYLAQDYGVAALYEIVGGPAAGRHVSLLGMYEDGEFVRAEILPEGWVVRARSEPGPGDGRPRAVEVRVLRAGGLLASGMLAPGDVLALPDGGRLVLNDLRWWARFNGARDASALPAYAGFAIVVLGAILLFGVIPVDTLVRVVPEDGMERVTVALRARRLTPLFAERFGRRIALEGGPTRDWRST